MEKNVDTKVSLDKLSERVGCLYAVFALSASTTDMAGVFYSNLKKLYTSRFRGASIYPLPS